MQRSHHRDSYGIWHFYSCSVSAYRGIVLAAAAVAIKLALQFAVFAVTSFNHSRISTRSES
jgi:hypothetical protein